MNAINRRSFLRGTATAAMFAMTPSLRAQSRTLVVMTSYPDDVVSRFQSAFEQMHPEYRVQIIWRMPQDALPYLQKPAQGGVDVYWSPSPRTFNRLKAEGALRKLDLDFSDLPEQIGKTRLRDVDGYFTATEMAGFGFALNEQALAKLAVAAPADWRDLANPKLAGHIALPNPAQVGFAPVLIDIPLQGYGWNEGWALWSEISALSVLMEHGAHFIGDGVGAGRYAIGLSIDFFVAAAIANGAPLTFAYPRLGGINPAHVAITTGCGNSAGARAFAQFVLSDQAQQLLMHADIRKLPVRPAVYAQAPPTYYRPFEAAARGELDYDNDKSRNRLGIVTALFNHHLAYRHDEQAALWQQLHQREASGQSMRELRALLGAVPLREDEAANAELQKQFRERVEGSAPALSDIEQRWRAATDRRIAEVSRLLSTP